MMNFQPAVATKNGSRDQPFLSSSFLLQLLEAPGSAAD
jgi:hypothetical protein